MSRARLSVLPNAGDEWAIGYGRVSSKEQAKGDSVSGQAPSCEQIAARYGKKLIAFYFDRPHTGKKVYGRKGWEAAVAAAKSGLAHVIVARDTTRFHRNGREFGDYEHRILNPAGIRLLSNDGLRKHDTASDYLHREAHDMFATMYSLDIGDKTRDGKLQMRLRGFWPDAAPYGYKRRGVQVGGEWLAAEDRELVPDPDTAPVVLELRDRLLSGESHDSIAVNFTSRCIPGPRGGPWYESTVFYIAANALYAGWITYQGKVLEGADGQPIRMRGEPLWSDEDYRRIRPKGKPAIRARDDRYIFAGLLFSSHFVCLTPQGRQGQIMPLKPKSQTHRDLLRYKPAHTFDSDYNGEPLDSLAAEFPAQLDAREVDALLMKHLVAAAAKNPDVTLVIPPEDAGEVKATVQQQLMAKRAEVARMRTLRDNAVEMKFLPEAEEYRASLQRLQLEEAALKRRLREVSTRTPATAKGKAVNVLAEAWRRKDIRACREIVGEMVDYIDVKATGPAVLVDGQWRVRVHFEVYVRETAGVLKAESPGERAVSGVADIFASRPMRLHERRRGRPRKSA